MNLLNVYDAEFSADVRKKVTDYMMTSGSQYRKKQVSSRNLNFTPPTVLNNQHMEKLAYIEQIIFLTNLIVFSHKFG